MAEPPYLVFCDVDETLITGKSMFEFLRFFLARRHGEQDGAQRYERYWATVQREVAAGRDRREINRDYYRGYAGESVEAVAALGREWFERRRAAGTLYLPETERAVRAHVAEGAELVLVSGSFAACLQPIASDVGATHLLCADLHTDRSGTVYTGAITEPVIGHGKRDAINRLLAGYPDLDLAGCYGYGDHASDIPMLALVGHPVAVGDDLALREYLAFRHVTAR